VNYRFKGPGRRTFVKIVLESGRTVRFPDAGKNPNGGGWCDIQNEDVIRAIEAKIANGDSRWERQPLDVAEPDSVKEIKERKKSKKRPRKTPLPPEPKDVEPEPEPEPEPEEEEDDL
jgi:hypothetical protein